MWAESLAYDFDVFVFVEQQILHFEISTKHYTSVSERVTGDNENINIG